MEKSDVNTRRIKNKGLIGTLLGIAFMSLLVVAIPSKALAAENSGYTPSLSLRDRFNYTQLGEIYASVYADCRFECYEIYYSNTGENGTYELKDTRESGITGYEDWYFNFDGIKDPLTGNYSDAYYYVLAVDNDGEYESAKSNVVHLSPYNQRRDGNDDYARIQFVQFEANGSYRPIDRLVIHEGEDIKIGLAFVSKNDPSKITLMKDVPAVSHVKSGVIDEGMQVSVSTNWDVYNRDDRAPLMRQDNIEFIPNAKDIGDNSDMYQYISGLKATEHRHLSNQEAASADDKWSDLYILADTQCYNYGRPYKDYGTEWAYLPVTVLPADPGASYNKATRTKICTSLAEVAGEIRKALVNRETDTGAVIYADENVNLYFSSMNEWEAFQNLIYDFDCERDDMKPYEGDYLKYSIGDRNSSVYWENGWDVGSKYSNGHYYKTINVKRKHITTRAEELQVDAYVANLLVTDATFRNAIASGSNEAKAWAAFNWTRSHMWSAIGDRTRPIVHTAYNGFIGDRSGTCEAYGLVYERLCREMGVPCKMIFGVDAGNHAYTITKMDDGYYYYVDPSSGIWKKSYYEFGRAQEQEQFKTKEFINNYIRKIKGYPGGYNPREDGNKATATYSLTLNGDIAINFQIKNYGTARFARIRCGSDTKIVPLTEGGSESVVSYKLAAKDINSKVTVTLLNANQNAVEMAPGYEIKDYSVAKYYEDIKKDPNASQKLKTMLAALLEYGKCADNYFNGANNAVADMSSVDLSTVARYEKSLSEGLNNQIKYVGTSLVLDSTTAIRVYFLLNGDNNVMVGMKKASDAEWRKFGDYGTKENLRYVEIANIPAAELDDTFSVRFADQTNQCVTELNYSGLSYAYAALSQSEDPNLKQLVKAMYLYNRAADDYFNSL